MAVKEIQPVQSEMYNNLMAVIDRVKKFTPQENATVGSLIKEIITLKYQLEAEASAKGYSQACRTSIPVCKGDCCKWHFPKNLTPVDFLISIFHMPTDQQTKLAQQICNNKKNQCPVLLENGCFLSFEQRPVLCTNAYPCFNDRSYWLEKEKKNILFNKTKEQLGAVLQI